MGEWRYYAQRAATGRWLDTNVQLSEVDLTWALSAPNSGKCSVLGGLNATPIAEDGRRTWGKWDTLLYAEEDENLQWVGVCNAAYPAGGNLNLEFVGVTGWLQRVPFMGDYSSWKVNAFDVVRMLIAHAKTYPNRLNIQPSANLSAYYLGDAQPPAKPTAPARKKGQTSAEYTATAAYKAYQTALENWNNTYSGYAPYSLGWWEGQYVGEEIDQIAKELDFEYRETYSWADRGALIPRFGMELADDMVRRRDDIAFVEGMNIAKLLAPKDGDEPYANTVIGLGAGEGRKMVRVSANSDDGRLYQAEFANYKAVRDASRLRNLVNADLRLLSNTEYAIDNVSVWDVEGYSSISTLRVGDEVNVKSNAMSPALDTWRRVVEINRNPEESVAILSLEYAK